MAASYSSCSQHTLPLPTPSHSHYKLSSRHSLLRLPASGSFSYSSSCLSSESNSYYNGNRAAKIGLKASATPAAPVMDQTSSSSPGVSTIVEVDLGDRSYPIYVGSGLLDQPQLLQRHVHGKKVLVVTNTTIAPLYLDKTIWALTEQNPNVIVESVILPDGEQYKNMDTLMKVFDKAIESRMDRRCTFVALGGGVIGDMCGYAAASYLRGVNFIQIPTTVMAQVDSSVGGKTGITIAKITGIDLCPVRSRGSRGQSHLVGAQGQRPRKLFGNLMTVHEWTPWFMNGCICHFGKDLLFG